ncbi:Transcription repressor OFP8 [Hibiscus syriacus]|uniref:Transcription repressor n=1 Tax=Hibiscus syriacus TaxID=106335 RepID=A0A6A2YUZ1_HIBSY|nr:Transcription repressor OFP8 [Hibiscus syriacus]
MFFDSSYHESVNYGGRSRGWWWFGSEDEAETLFSSRTLSSSEWQQHRDHRRKHNASRRRAKSGNKVKDSFSVMKNPDDPYTDFRASMVEMIVEREIFEAKESEQLLQCYLLNSHHHHRVIFEVFTEICKTLFSNWS